MKLFGNNFKIKGDFQIKTLENNSAVHIHILRVFKNISQN